MFFNLKEAAEHGVNVGTNWSSYSHSAIRFEDANSHSEFVKPIHTLQIYFADKTDTFRRHDVSTMQFGGSHSGDEEYVI